MCHGDIRRVPGVASKIAIASQMPARRQRTNTPVIHPGNAAWLVREHRPNDAPLVITELIAPGWMSAFGGYPDLE